MAYQNIVIFGISGAIGNALMHLVSAQYPDAIIPQKQL
jgi:hypothetical protein